MTMDHFQLGQNESEAAGSGANKAAEGRPTFAPTGTRARCRRAPHYIIGWCVLARKMRLYHYRPVKIDYEQMIHLY